MVRQVMMVILVKWCRLYCVWIFISSSVSEVCGIRQVVRSQFVCVCVVFRFLVICGMLVEMNFCVMFCVSLIMIEVVIQVVECFSDIGWNGSGVGIGLGMCWFLCCGVVLVCVGLGVVVLVIFVVFVWCFGLFG